MRHADYCDRYSRCLSVCLSRGFTMQTRLSGSRSCLGWRLLGKEHCIRWGPDFTQGFDAALLWPLVIFWYHSYFPLKTLCLVPWSLDLSVWTSHEYERSVVQSSTLKKRDARCADEAWMKEDNDVTSNLLADDAGFDSHDVTSSLLRHRTWMQ